MKPVNGRHFGDVAPDFVVGRLIDGAMQTQVSVRTGLIVIAHGNQLTGRGVEVVYSPEALIKLTDILSSAVRVAQGRGN